MTRINYIFYILIGSMFLTNANAQSFINKIESELDTMTISYTHKRADHYFEGLAYPKAIEKYNKLIEKEFAPDSVRRNLAISYLKINETQKSEELFAEIVASGEYKPMDLYYYSQSLKYNQKYDEADKWIDKYKTLENEDARGNLQHESAPVIKEILSKEKYKLESAWFNTKYSEFGAVSYQGEIVFASGRNENAIIQYEYSWKGSPYLDLYRASEEKPLVYTDPKLITKGINSRFHDGPLAYSTNEQEVYVTRNNFHLGMPKYSETKENHFKIYKANLEEGKWDELVELPFNSDEYSCGHPSISADNNTLYFASDMPGGYGESDIYYVTRTGEGWSEPVNLGREINTEGDEMFPYISQTDELYFSSNGHLGLGGLDVFMASSTGNNTYGILNMGHPLNSSSDDFSFYLKPDGVNGYFASNRAEGKGDDDIYLFTILDKPSYTATIVGITKDKLTGEIIPNAQAEVKDTEGKQIYSGKSDTKGKFEAVVTPGLYYTIKVTKEKYTETTEKILADKAKMVENEIKVEILLNPIQEWGVFGLIYEKETSKGVKEVDIIITNKSDGTEINEITDKEGKFRRLLEPETDYDILLRKTKYFTRRGEISTKNMEPGWININEFIEVEMEEIVVGKTIEIPNIYYDVAKWNIREDAAVELKKVIQFLQDNPTITIELGSHTDARGSNSSNQELSQKRAESAVTYIVSNGIDSKRITAKGYGESKLKNRCADGVKCSAEEHQENRRTEIKIVDF